MFVKIRLKIVRKTDGTDLVVAQLHVQDHVQLRRNEAAVHQLIRLHVGRVLILDLHPAAAVQSLRVQDRVLARDVRGGDRGLEKVSQIVGLKITERYSGKFAVTMRIRIRTMECNHFENWVVWELYFLVLRHSEVFCIYSVQANKEF